MAYNHEYPYVDPNRYNADWILNKIKELEGEMDTFEALNKITFAGEWDITKQYPAWTIVNTDNGQQGYISVKPVPAGVTIDNTEYWTSVVNYTATIADLQNRVITLEGQMTTLNNVTIPGINSDISDLEDRVDRLDHRKYIFIGDSYNTTDTPVGGTQIVPWGPKVAEYLGLSASDYYNIGESGCGFVHGGTFLNLLNTISASVTDKDAITDIVVLGGVNDISETLADLDLAMVAFINQARTLYPNAMITIGFISWVKTEASREKVRNMLQYYEDKERFPRVRIFSDAYKFYHYYDIMYQSDGHPTALGTNAIARGISNYLKGGNPNVHWIAAPCNVTFNSGLNITSGSMALTFEQTDNKVITRLPGHVNLSSSGCTISPETPFVLGTFAPYTFARFSPISPISGSMYVYNGTFYTMPITLELEDNELKIRPLLVEGAGLPDFTNVTLIKLVFPSIFETPIEYC